MTLDPVRVVKSSDPLNCDGPISPFANSEAVIDHSTGAEALGCGAVVVEGAVVAGLTVVSVGGGAVNPVVVGCAVVAGAADVVETTELLVATADVGASVDGPGAVRSAVVMVTPNPLAVGVDP